MTTPEKVAYLKGLMEGMGIDTDSKDGKLFSVISGILEDLSLDVEDIQKNADELSDEVDAISDDLEDIENIVYDDDDEDDCDEDDDEDEDEDDDESPDFFEVTCPSCNNTITIDEDVLNLGSIQCPHCGEMLEFDSQDVSEDEDSKD